MSVLFLPRICPGKSRAAGKKSRTLCATFPVLSLTLPWIDDVNAAVLKVFRVARSEACSSRTSHGDNHGIELADGFTCSSSRGADIRVHIRCFAVETQYLIGEVRIKNLHRGIP